MRFSIIIPVYNVERYLQECVKSVLEQSFQNFEIILVDDGSKDNSGKLCDELSEKNDTIKVIHKENGGLSDARNFGIKEAKGEYLVFLDSDDFWDDTEFLEKLNEIIQKKEKDLIIIGLKKYFESTNRIEEKDNEKLNNNESIEELLKNNLYKACACSEIIKRNIVIENNLYFPKGRLSEDIEWCARVLKVIDLNKIYYFPNNVYVYRQRENSISKKVDDLFIKDIYEMIKNETIYNDDKENIVNSYLAYEYSVLLGWTSLKCKDKDLKKKVYSLKNILKYNIVNKVKYVNIMVNVLGIKFSCYILGKFIEIKNN